MIVDIFMKSQPAIIRINGCRGELAVYVSNNHKFPDEENNQQCYRNQSKIEFFTKGAEVGTSKFVKNSLYISLESETDEADVRVSVNFGAEDK